MREVECLSKQEKVALVKEELMTPGGKWLDILRTRSGKTLVAAAMVMQEFTGEVGEGWQTRLTEFCEAIKEANRERIGEMRSYKIAGYSPIAGGTVINIGLAPDWDKVRGKGVWLNFIFYSKKLQLSFDTRREQEYDQVFERLEDFKQIFFERLARAIVEADQTLDGWVF